MSIPKNYSEGVPRVSNIISFIHPFEGTENERRYLERLYSKGINQEEYLEASQEIGTFVHEQLETSIKLYKNKASIGLDFSSPLRTENEKEIRHGINFIASINNIQEAVTEQYIIEENNRFQGSCDILYIDNDGKTVLADWKTWGINKKRFGLPNKFIVPTDKKKKVQLQLSFYAYGLRQAGINIDRLELLYIHKEGLKVVELEFIPDEEIERYLDLYEAHLKEKDIIILFPNKNNMFEIEILVPTEKYGNIKIKADLSKIDNGKTVQENVDDLITTAKYCRQKYLKDSNNGNKD